MSNDIVKLSKEILEANNNEKENISNLDEIEKGIQELKKELENHEKGTRMYEVLSNKIKSKKEKIEEQKSKKEELEEKETKFLEELSKNFVPEEKWLDESVLKTINFLLTGKISTEIFIKDYQIDQDFGGDLENFESEDLIEISQITSQIKTLAKEKLGESSDLEEFWDKFSSSKKFPPFRIVANSDQPVEIQEIVDRLSEKRSKVGNNLRNTIHQSDYNPYYREDGRYMLSIIGKFFDKHYLDKSSKEKKQDEKEDVKDTNSKKEKDVKQTEPQEQKTTKQKFFDEIGENPD